jgi:predicted Ser/Thr protein kinase
MEEVIEQVKSLIFVSPQGAGEETGILYLLEAVGGGKSSIAEETQKYLMEQFVLLH